MNQSFDPSFSPQSTTLQTFMQRVYQWMAVGLTVTGLIALWTSTQMGIMRALAGGGFLALMFAELGLVFWLSSQITKISAKAAITGFLVYSALNGITISFIFLAYTGASIATTFFIAAATFAGVSLFAWTTKSDLSSFRGILMMSLIGVIVASVVNIFLQSPVLYWIISYAGVAVFIGMTAYDTQALKQMHQSGVVASEQMAIVGALKLYLDFINLFLFLLRIFGRRRD